jgi:Uma2 family endonuclease
MVVAPEKRRFTVDEFLRMAEVGILCEHRLELIDGEVLEMSPIGQRHSAALSSATRSLVMAAGDAANRRGVFQSVEQFRRGQPIAPKLLPACVVAVDVFLQE